MLVGGVDKVAQPVVYEFLSQRAGLHVGVHIQFLHLEALVLQHALHGDNVWVYLAPTERLYGGVYNIGTVITHLEDAGHGEAGPRVSVILYDNVGVLRLDALGQCAEHGRLAYTSHILQAYFLGTSSNHLVGNVRVILHRMHG